MGLMRKAEEALTGHHESSRSTNHGPHDSNVMNKMDPRVDSDRDNRARHQAMGGAAGPHNSDLANKVDPRVDSDRDNRGALNSTTGVSHSGRNTDYSSGPHQHNVPGNTYGNTYGSSTTTSTNAGPHSSNVANKLDPRVDSDMDNRARHDALAGSSYNNPVAGATAGPHSTNTANKLDPRVDSDLDNRGTTTQRRNFV